MHIASEDDVNEAVRLAAKAQKSWEELGVEERAPCFYKLANLIRNHAEEFARLDSLAMGRPVSTYFDAGAAASSFEFFAQAMFTLHGETSLNTAGFINYTLKHPYGVVAAIIPWNGKEIVRPLVFVGLHIAGQFRCSCWHQKWHQHWQQETQF